MWHEVCWLRVIPLHRRWRSSAVPLERGTDSRGKRGADSETYPRQRGMGSSSAMLARKARVHGVAWSWVRYTMPNSGTLLGS